MRDTLLRNALTTAKLAFDRLGLIPLDIAGRLMRLGVSVPALEDQWMRRGA